MTAIPHHWNQRVARRLRKTGRERTPAEVAEDRRACMPYVRIAWASRGSPLPDGELEALNFMRAAQGQKPISESGPDSSRCDPIG